MTIDLLASDWFWSLPFPFVGFPIFVSRDRLKRKTEKNRFLEIAVSLFLPNSPGSLFFKLCRHFECDEKESPPIFYWLSSCFGTLNHFSVILFVSIDELPIKKRFIIQCCNINYLAQKRVFL